MAVVNCSVTGGEKVSELVWLNWKNGNDKKNNLNEEIGCGM